MFTRAFCSGFVLKKETGSGGHVEMQLLGFAHHDKFCTFDICFLGSLELALRVPPFQKISDSLINAFQASSLLLTDDCKRFTTGLSNMINFSL